MIEKWLPIKECPYYEISNHGRVRSWLREGGNKRTILDEPKIIKCCSTKNSYVKLQFANNGQDFSYYLHRLVLEYFVGPPGLAQECRHLDGNRKNNHIDNLKWGTRSENVRDAINHGTYVGLKSYKGSENNSAKLDEGKVREIKSLIASNSLTSIASKYSVSVSTIWLIKEGKKWTHV